MADYFTHFSCLLDVGTPDKADHYLDLSRRTPRWLENWQDRASGQLLQVDENDLWIVAQSVERDYLLVTSDQRLADRFLPAIPELRLSVV